MSDFKSKFEALLFLLSSRVRYKVKQGNTPKA